MIIHTTETFFGNEFDLLYSDDNRMIVDKKTKEEYVRVALPLGTANIDDYYEGDAIVD